MTTFIELLGASESIVARWNDKQNNNIFYLIERYENMVGNNDMAVFSSSRSKSDDNESGNNNKVKELGS